MNKSKTAMIVEWLMEEIEKEHFRTGNKIPSEYELAELFSVNKKTANKAVSELVVKGLVERRRGGGGSIVSRNPSLLKGNIAVFMTGRVSYYYNLLYGFQEGAFRRGYNLYFYNSPDITDFGIALNRLKAVNTSGAIVTHLQDFPSDMPFPVLWINDLPPDSHNCNQLHHNNYLGGRMIAEHLLELGHRKIIYVAQNNTARPLQERNRGFADALSRAGIEILSTELFSGTSLSAKEFTERLLKRFPDATAIACDGDNIAISLYLALRELGICIPKDISLTGFSCLPEVQSLVKITTVDEKPCRIGSYAAELMADIIEGRLAEPVNETFNMEFISGNTTGVAAG